MHTCMESGYEVFDAELRFSGVVNEVRQISVELIFLVLCACLMSFARMRLTQASLQIFLNDSVLAAVFVSGRRRPKTAGSCLMERRVVRLVHNVTSSLQDAWVAMYTESLPDIDGELTIRRKMPFRAHNGSFDCVRAESAVTERLLNGVPSRSKWFCKFSLLGNVAVEQSPSSSLIFTYQ